MDSSTIHYMSEISCYVTLIDYNVDYSEKRKSNEDIVDISDIEFKEV